MRGGDTEEEEEEALLKYDVGPYLAEKCQTAPRIRQFST